MHPVTSSRTLRVVAAAALTLASISASAAVTAYTNQAVFASAVGGVTVETFESLSIGTITAIPSLGISSMSGTNSSGSTTAQFVGSAASLPFPMFIPPLPSGTQFLSNNLSGPTFGSGSILFTFSALQTAVGAFVTDNSPLGDFSIELFAGSTAVGAISVGPRSLPDSFVGVSSTIAFDRARFFGVQFDSWGLDDLQVARSSAQVAAVPTPGAYGLLLTGLGILSAAGTRRRRS